MDFSAHHILAPYARHCGILPFATSAYLPQPYHSTFGRRLSLGFIEIDGARTQPEQHQANRIRCESFIGDPFSVSSIIFDGVSPLQRRIAGSIHGVIGMLYLHAVRIFCSALRPAAIAFDKLKSVFVCVYHGGVSMVVGELKSTKRSERVSFRTAHWGFCRFHSVHRVDEPVSATRPFSFY